MPNMSKICSVFPLAEQLPLQIAQRVVSSAPGLTRCFSSATHNSLGISPSVSSSTFPTLNFGLLWMGCPGIRCPTLVLENSWESTGFGQMWLLSRQGLRVERGRFTGVGEEAFWNMSSKDVSKYGNTLGILDGRNPGSVDVLRATEIPDWNCCFKKALSRYLFGDIFNHISDDQF